LLISICVFCRVPTAVGKWYAMATLFILFPQAVTVLPDLGAAALMLLAILALERRSTKIDGVFFATAAFIGFMFKMTASFVAVPFLIIMMWDAVRTRQGEKFPHTFYATAICTTAAFFCLYGVSLHLLTGDPIARLGTSNDLSDQHLWSIETFDDLARRLIVEPLGFFYGYLGAAFLLAIIGGIAALSDRTKDSTIAIYFFTGLLLFLFGSVSTSDYQPLPLIERMVAYLVPPIAILSSILLPRLVEGLDVHRIGRNLIFACFLILAVHQSATPIAAQAYTRISSGLHDARILVVEKLVTDPRSHVFLAEPRTKEMISVYAGFMDLDNARLSVCPTEDEFKDLEQVAVFIDRSRANFLDQSYGTGVCAETLEQMARAASLDVKIETGRVFFASLP